MMKDYMKLRNFTFGVSVVSIALALAILLISSELKVQVVSGIVMFANMLVVGNELDLDEKEFGGDELYED